MVGLPPRGIGLTSWWSFWRAHLDLRALTEPRLTGVADADGVPRGAVETGHARGPRSVFGEVDVRRLAYRRRGRPNLHPADGALNLPAEQHSHGLRRLVMVEAARGSFDEVVAAMKIGHDRLAD